MNNRFLFLIVALVLFVACGEPDSLKNEKQKENKTTVSTPSPKPVQSKLVQKEKNHPDPFSKDGTFQKWLDSLDYSKKDNVIRVIAKLVSPNPPIRKDGHYGIGMGGGKKHPQVIMAAAKLKELGPSILPQLVLFIDDERFSFSEVNASWVNYSVGSMVQRIIAASNTVACGSGYKGQPSFGQYLAGVDYVIEWANAASVKSKRQLQVEYVEWYITKEKNEKNREQCQKWLDLNKGPEPNYKSCIYPLPENIRDNSIDEIPDEYLLKAMLPSYNMETGHTMLGEVLFEEYDTPHGKQRNRYFNVSGCARRADVKVWDETREYLKKTKVVTQKLQDGMLAVWAVLVDNDHNSAPYGTASGFLGLLRKSKKGIEVVSIGEWENGADAKQIVGEELVNGKLVLTEFGGEEGTGGGGGGHGERLWMDFNGILKIAGEFDSESYSSALSLEPDWSITFEESGVYGGINLVRKTITTYSCDETDKESKEFIDVLDYKLVGEKFELVKGSKRHKADYNAVCYDGEVLFLDDCKEDEMCRFKIAVQEFANLLTWGSSANTIAGYMLEKVPVINGSTQKVKQSFDFSSFESEEMLKYFKGVYGVDIKMLQSKDIAHVQYKKIGTDWLFSSKRKDNNVEIKLFFVADTAKKNWRLREIVEVQPSTEK